MNPLDKFIAIAPPIDEVRHEAARCCEETAKYERGERAALRLSENPLLSEFRGEAAGTAAEVAMIVMHALKAKGYRATTDFYWDVAAKLLRNGWKRGDRILGHVVGKDVQ